MLSVQELKKYLTDQEIEKIKEKSGNLIARVRIPDGIWHLTCDLCGVSLIGEVFVIASYDDLRRKYPFTCNWLVHYVLCHDCVERLKKDYVFVTDWIIPGLQSYFEWYLSLE